MHANTFVDTAKNALIFIRKLNSTCDEKQDVVLGITDKFLCETLLNNDGQNIIPFTSVKCTAEKVSRENVIIPEHGAEMHGNLLKGHDFDQTSQIS